MTEGETCVFFEVKEHVHRAGYNTNLNSGERKLLAAKATMSMDVLGGLEGSLAFAGAGVFALFATERSK